MSFLSETMLCHKPMDLGLAYFQTTPTVSGFARSSEPNT